jgi:predicted nuclease of restriction endonuclease-like (RecB) superfamily
MERMELETASYQELLGRISQAYTEGRLHTFQSVNIHMTATYWKIGHDIVEYEQGGKIKAGYGKALLANLSRDLILLHGRGFSRSNLVYMRLLYLRYPISQKLSDLLSWSHYVELLKIDDDLERSFYEKQAILERWSVPELKRQKDSALFLRLAAGKDKTAILKLAAQGQLIEQPSDILRDPYVFEFLKIPEPYLIPETRLETLLYDHLQQFLLELGKGFTFVGRQYRITVNNTHYRVDLVFYHRILRCFVLIESFWPHDTTLWVKDFKGNHPAYVALVLQNFHLERLDAATSVPTLNRNNLAGHSIAVTFIKAEQEAIAEALSDADALIESLEQLIAKKRQIKQGAMQELLRPRDGWVWKKLGDLASIQRGASPRPIDSPIWFDDNSSIGWVRISDVTRSGMFLRETTQRLSTLGIRHSRPVSRGSLIMSICATVGRPVITEIDICIHDGFVVFDHLRTDKYFMYYILKSIEGDWARHGQTGSQMNLNTGLINRTEITVPPKAEQTAIATILSDMDTEIAALEEKLAKAHQLKQSMMQELLTGRIRLV